MGLKAWLRRIFLEDDSGSPKPDAEPHLTAQPGERVLRVIEATGNPAMRVHGSYTDASGALRDQDTEEVISPNGFRIQDVRADIILGEPLFDHEPFDLDIVYRVNVETSTTRRVTVLQVFGSVEDGRMRLEVFSARCHTFHEDRNFLANYRLSAARSPGRKWYEGYEARRYILNAAHRRR